MHPLHLVRPSAPEDLPGMKAILDATGLFLSELLDDMTASYFAGAGAEESWLTADAGDGPLAFAYCMPERMAEGTWNLLAIAVDPGHQRKKIGAALTAHIENDLARGGQRVLLVETSGLPEFEGTRAFYRSSNYVEEARIRDFYAAGDDKVVFWKSLT